MSSILITQKSQHHQRTIHKEPVKVGGNIRLLIPLTMLLIISIKTTLFRRAQLLLLVVGDLCLEAEKTRFVVIVVLALAVFDFIHAVKFGALHAAWGGIACDFDVVVRMKILFHVVERASGYEAGEGEENQLHLV